MPVKVAIYGLETIPKIRRGDDIGEKIVEAALKEKVGIEEGDIIVVSSKIVSKSEGRIIDLKEITPNEEARRVAAKVAKDPRLVELILRESKKVIKAEKGHLIVKTRWGFTCANAGIDRSNVRGDADVVILLPENPDLSARKIRLKVEKLTGKNVSVVITDTYGRPLREGQVDMAIGSAGICPFKDYRGKKDLEGYVLKAKLIALLDEIAAAAELVKGNGAEGIPVAIIRGLKYDKCKETDTRILAMKEEKWLFLVKMLKIREFFSIEHVKTLEQGLC